MTAPKPRDFTGTLDGTPILVTFWPTGEVDIATRPAGQRCWGPPTTLTPTPTANLAVTA